MAGTEEQVKPEVVVPDTATPSSPERVRGREPGHGRGHRPLSRPGPGGHQAAWPRAAARSSPPGRRSASRVAPASCKRMQKWVMDHQEEVIAVIRSETGKTYEDALIAEISYGAAAFGFWATQRREVPGRREGQVVGGARQGQEAAAALPPARPHRRHRPVELPADELLRRLHPGAGRGQQRDPQAVGDHAADLAEARRGPAASAASPRASSRSRPAWARRAPRWSTRST